MPQETAARAAAPPQLDARVPPREDCVAPLLLERWARETPQAVFARLPDGELWPPMRCRANWVKTK